MSEPTKEQVALVEETANVLEYVSYSTGDAAVVDRLRLISRADEKSEALRAMLREREDLQVANKYLAEKGQKDRNIAQRALDEYQKELGVAEAKLAEAQREIERREYAHIAVRKAYDEYQVGSQARIRELETQAEERRGDIANELGIHLDSSWDACLKEARALRKGKARCGELETQLQAEREGHANLLTQEQAATQRFKSNASYWSDQATTAQRALAAEVEKRKRLEGKISSSLQNASDPSMACVKVGMTWVRGMLTALLAEADKEGSDGA